MHWPLRLGMLTLVAVMPGCLRATCWRDRADASSAHPQRQPSALAKAAEPPPAVIIRQAAGPGPRSEEPTPEADSLLTLPTARPARLTPDGAEAPARAELNSTPTEARAPDAENADVTTAAKTQELNRLLRALRAFLEDRPDEAVQLLKPYSAKDQELLLALLPVVASVERKGAWPESLEPAQKLAVIDTLRSLSATLEPSAPLVIKKLEFVRSVHGFGRYEPLPASTFRPGDFVSLYLEIENLHDQRVSANQYLVRLGSELTIRRDGTNEGWHLVVPATPDVSRSPRDDHHAVINFKIPYKDPPPPGSYTLRVEVIDLDSRIVDPDMRRRAKKSLPFRISNQSASEGSSARR